jgi:hypothetical protein
MRHYIRRWITLWDMERLAPEGSREIVVDSLRPDLTEDLPPTQET